MNVYVHRIVPICRPLLYFARLQRPQADIVSMTHVIVSLWVKYSSYPQEVEASTQPLYFYNDLFSTSALTSTVICAGLYGYVKYAEVECGELCQGGTLCLQARCVTLRLHASVCDMYDSWVVVKRLIPLNWQWLTRRPHQRLSAT